MMSRNDLFSDACSASDDIGLCGSVGLYCWICSKSRCRVGSAKMSWHASVVAVVNGIRSCPSDVVDDVAECSDEDVVAAAVVVTAALVVCTVCSVGDGFGTFGRCNSIVNTMRMIRIKRPGQPQAIQYDVRSSLDMMVAPRT